MAEPRGPPRTSVTAWGSRSPSPACLSRVTASLVSSCTKSTSASVRRTRATTVSASARPQSRFTVSTRRTGPLAAGCGRRAARGRSVLASTAALSAAVAAGPRCLARASASADAEAAAAACGVNDSSGARGASTRRTRSAAVILAAAHAASPPATAQEALVRTFDPMSGTVLTLRAPGAGAFPYGEHMRLLRTADDRFRDLPGFPYPPRYAEVPAGDGESALRIGYVADGPADGPVVLLLHGEPSWSFLYRSMLPVLARAGLRAIAPDMPGFGRSDKPAEVADHSFARHVEWMRS